MVAPNAFRQRLLPAPVDGGFTMPGYFVWCGSPIRGEDGQYHLFASRWPTGMTFHPHWLTNAEIVRAVSTRPEGPYAFAEVILPPRGEGEWDGRSTFNPTVHKVGSTYLLYYTGTTYGGPTPTPDWPTAPGTEQVLEARANQRIGVATADTILGPWTRRDTPILEPRPGHWDGLMVTNAAPCVLADGGILMIYKAVATQDDLLRLGVAKADRHDQAFERLVEGPILQFDDTGDHVEDPYVWITAEGTFEMVMKDMNGGISGQPRAGIHAQSDDGISWHVTEPALAYSRDVLWDDGTRTEQEFLDRPQLLFEDGHPTHLFLATGVGDGSMTRLRRTWNMVIPLAPAGDEERG